MFSIMSRLPAFYIFGVIWVSLLGLLLYIVINIWHPAKTSNQALKFETGNLREETIHIIGLNEFSKNYSSLKQELKVYKTRLDAPLSESSLTERLYQIASENSVTVLSESNKKKRNKTLGVTMKSLLLEGKYTDIRKYIYNLNKIKSMVFIKRIELKNKKKSKKVKAAIQISVYTASK